VKFPKIRHPEWLESDHPFEASAIGNTLRLYREGKLPSTIAGCLIVNAATRPLRAVYGSNLRAGIALVFDSLIDKFTHFRYRFRLLTPTERQWEQEFESEEFEREICEALKGIKHE
jgi:hypothetical protein